MLPAQLAGCATVLHPAFLSLSPALGLAATNSSLTRNLAGLRASAPEALLARELFLHAGGKLRPTTTRSKPGAHLDTAAWGSLIGLAVGPAGAERVDQVLRGEHQIATRLGNQSRPPPSFGRYCRLVELVRQALRTGRGAGLLAQYTWEKAASKADLLHFLQALHRTSPQPVLRAEFAESEAAQQAWLEDEFSEAELSCGDRMASAALRVLDERGSDLEWARHFEAVTAGLSRLGGSRTPVRLRRFMYGQGKEVPDCVEVAVRELVELVLFRPHNQQFDLARLPGPAAPALRRFFEMANDKLRRGGAAQSEQEQAGEWFALCQDLPTGQASNGMALHQPGDHGLEYVSRAPCGGLFELKPTTRTIARALHQLLLGGEGERPWDSLEEFAQFWRARQPGCSLKVTEERQIRRSLVSEGSAITQRATVWLDGQAMHIELDPIKNIATCRHVPCTPEWALPGSDVHSAHLARALGGSNETSPRMSALSLVWPALLGSAALDALSLGSFSPTALQAMRAVMAADFDEQYVDESGFKVADMTIAEAARARRNAGRRVLDAIRIVTRLASHRADFGSRDTHLQGDNAAAEMAQDSLPWLLRLAPAELSAREVAFALSGLSPELLLADAELREALDQRDGGMLTRMVEFEAESVPLRDAFKGLGSRHLIDMARFVAGTAIK